MSVRLVWLCLFFAILFVRPAEALSIKATPPVPGADNQALREVNLSLFPTAPATINVSSAPVAYLSDLALHLQPTSPIDIPPTGSSESITTTVVFTLQNSQNVATYTGVITNTSSTTYSSCGEFSSTTYSSTARYTATVNGTVISTTTSSSPSESIGGFEASVDLTFDNSDLGPCTLTITRNGQVVDSVTGQVQTMNVQNFELANNTLTGSIVGLPNWTPSTSTMWTILVQDAVTQATYFTFTGTGTSINQPFNAQQALQTLNPPPAQGFSYNVTALDPVNYVAATAAAEALSILNLAASLTNSNGNPEFIPSESQVETITGTIVATGFTPTNVTWMTSITDSSGTVVKTFAAVGSASINLAWDGSDNSGNLVPNDTYTVTISATCAQGISTQAMLDVQVDPPLPTIKVISATVLPMVDNNNVDIKAPQYDADSGIHNPMAFMLYPGTPQMAKVTVSIPVTENQPGWGIYGQDASGELVFGPTMVEKIAGNRTKRFPYSPPGNVSRVGVVLWYAVDKAGGPYFIGSTNSPIYNVILKPQRPQLKPRIDVLDFAVASATGAIDPPSVRSAITSSIYSDNGFYYDPTEGESVHTTSNPDGSNMILTVSNFIHFGEAGNTLEGNCQDFSNLFQVSCASLGVTAEVRRFDGKLSKPYPYAWVTNPVLAIGLLPPYQALRLTFHQVGWLANPGTVFDPTYIVNEGSPTLPIDMPEATYKMLLVNESIEYSWIPRRPTRPVAVK